jgi:hypothetical protein
MARLSVILVPPTQPFRGLGGWTEHFPAATSLRGLSDLINSKHICYYTDVVKLRVHSTFTVRI